MYTHTHAHVYVYEYFYIYYVTTTLVGLVDLTVGELTFTQRYIVNCILCLLCCT